MGEKKPDAADTQCSPPSLLDRVAGHFRRGPAREKDRDLHLRRRGLAILTAIAALAVVYVFSHLPNGVESIYSAWVGPLVGLLLARISGVAPFSLVEILFGLSVVWFLLSFGTGVYHVVRGKRRALNAIVCGFLRLGVVVGVLLLIFYVSWGLNYARPGLVTRMGWEEEAPKSISSSAKADVDELARLCEELVEAANFEYERANGCRELERPSAPSGSWRALDKVIDKAYVGVAERLGLGRLFAASRGRAKPVAVSGLMCRLLILGFYSPWTGEANYNCLAPACKLPQTIAHEKSHQRGIASEDEANFFGYLACVHSDDPYVRYSGYLFAQRTLLSELLKVDRDRAKALLKKRHPGVQRDVDAIHEFTKRHHGTLSKVSHATNNAYLKANRVKGGIRSYQMCSRLIVAFSRVNGGACLVQ